LPNARGDETRSLELAVQVEEDGFAAVASQVAALAEATEPAAELVVDDGGAVAAQRLGDRQRQCVRVGLSRQRDLDLRHRSAMVSVSCRPRRIDSPRAL